MFSHTAMFSFLMLTKRTFGVFRKLQNCTHKGFYIHIMYNGHAGMLVLIPLCKIVVFFLMPLKMLGMVTLCREYHTHIITININFNRFLYTCALFVYNIILLYLIEIITDITEDVIRPLLLSAVSSDLTTPAFIASVNTAVADITNALNGNDVDLTQTLSNYFLAVSRVYFNEAIDSVGLPITLSDNQTECGVRATFGYIYTNADAAAELVDLLQNISQAISILNQVAD